MHRSGTSSLVGSLEAAGLPLGEVRSEGGASNPKGHREPGELIALHEDILIASGGAWHLPPERVTWTDAHRTRRDAFIASRAGLPAWGWKEPRTLLLVDFWLEAIPDLEMVATFRHPLVVARSLQRRHGSADLDMWLDLWLAYNQRLLSLVRERAFPLVDFDLPDGDHESRLRGLVDELGLPDPQGAAGFFEGSLRTSQKQKGKQPRQAPGGEVERVYRELQAAAAAQAS
jgi:hypothetical protein